MPSITARIIGSLISFLSRSRMGMLTEMILQLKAYRSEMRIVSLLRFRLGMLSKKRLRAPLPLVKRSWNSPAMYNLSSNLKGILAIPYLTSVPSPRSSAESFSMLITLSVN